MNNNEIDNLIKKAEKKTGMDIDKMKQAAENGRLDDFVNKNLSSKGAAELKNVLTNREAVEKLLSTPEAKELMKKLTEGK